MGNNSSNNGDAMKSIYCIVFCLFITPEVTATNNTSADIGVTVTSNPISDVSVTPASIKTTIDDIFDLTETSQDNQDVGTVTVTYQTNTPNHKLVLTSNEIYRNNFHLHHDLWLDTNSGVRLLLNITNNGSTIRPGGTLVSTDSSTTVLDDKLTLKVQLQPDAINTTHSGEYNSTLTIIWMST